MAQASVHAGPIIATVSNVCSVVDNIKKIKEQTKKVKEIASLLAVIHDAIETLPNNFVQLDKGLGQRISREVSILIHKDLKELKEIIGFVGERYKLNLAIQERNTAISYVQLQITLVSAAFSFITAGSAMVIGEVLKGGILLANSVVNNYNKLKRYQRKVAEFDKKSTQTDKDLRRYEETKDPRYRITYREKTLQNWAGKISKNSRFQAFFANVLIGDGDSENYKGITIDELQRIKLASFMISTKVRIEIQGELKTSGPSQVIVKIAELISNFFDQKAVNDGAAIVLSKSLFLASDLGNIETQMKDVNESFAEAVKKVARIIK